ncbi:MAG: rhomboid family intramembrane serine protease [Planctomycetota bacterium]
MFLPIGDTPNPRQFIPWMNWLLIAVNILVYGLVTLPLSSRGVNPSDPAIKEYLRHILPLLPDGVTMRQFLAQITSYDLFVFAHGFKPGAPLVGDLFFSMFLHVNFLHLAGNMLFLWIYGDNVEHRLGRIGYLAAYLVTGIVATLAFSAMSLSSMTPMVGASGAISGVLGFYFLFFPRNSVKVFIFLFPILMDVILLPARWVLGIYVLFDNLLPIIWGAKSGVAYGAHLGGFLGGLGLAWVVDRVNWRAFFERPQRAAKGPSPGSAKPEEVSADPLTRLRSAMAMGELGGVLEALTSMSRSERARMTPRESLELSRWFAERGRIDSAVHILRGCIASHPRSGELAEIFLALGLLRLTQGQPTAAYQHLLSVFDYNPSQEIADETRKALQRIDVFRK